MRTNWLVLAGGIGLFGVIHGVIFHNGFVTLIMVFLGLLVYYFAEGEAVH